MAEIKTVINKKRRVGAEKKVIWAFFAFFCVMLLLCLFPFLLVINNSLKTAEEFFDSALNLTESWFFQNYIKVFLEFKVKGSNTYFDMLFNSLWQTLAYVIANIVSSVMLAYVVARYRFPGRGIIYGVVIFVKTIPIIGTEAAAFKLKVALGMVNNPTTIWIAWAVGFDFTFLVLYGAFKSISSTYAEAARIDGAGNLTILFKVILPQALPAIAAVAVTNIMSRWNDYQVSQINLSNYPNLAYGLFIFNTESAWAVGSKGVYFAAVIITALPVVLIFILCQSMILKNVTIGGIKG